MNRIVLIGAGSTNFGLGTVGEIFKSQVLKGSTIVLHYISPITLKKIKAHCLFSYVNRSNCG